MAREFLGDDQPGLVIGLVEQVLGDLLELHEIAGRMMGFAHEQVDEDTQKNRADVDVGRLPQSDEPLQGTSQIVALAHAYAPQIPHRFD